MLTKHAIIWSIFPNMLFCHMERIDRFSLLYQDRPQNISFFSRYIVTRQLHSKIVQERKRKEWFINSLLCCTEKDLWAYSSLFFSWLPWYQSDNDPFPLVVMSKSSWLTECYSNLFSFRGMIALKRRDSVDLETTTYQVDRALRDRRKKLVKRNTIADFYKHDVNSDSGTNGECILVYEFFWPFFRKLTFFDLKVNTCI